jgi:hypothetical protein
VFINRLKFSFLFALFPRTPQYIVKSIRNAFIFTFQPATAVGVASRLVDKMVVGTPYADASLSDGSRTSESLQYQDNILGESDDDDSDTESDSSDYLSFGESDDEHVYPETKAEREARANERQLVLEAAGLIVTQHDKPPPALVRARSNKRRPAPVVPDKQMVSISASLIKDLPPVPEPAADPEPDHAKRLDDAFDRYESFKNSQYSSNRMSIASTLSGEAFPSSPTISITPSRERDGESKSYSHFLNFLGRSRTPEEKEKSTGKLSISAPIVQGSGDSDPSSPVFGSVCCLTFEPSLALTACLYNSLGQVWLTGQLLKVYPQESAADKKYVHCSYAC